MHFEKVNEVNLYLIFGWIIFFNANVISIYHTNLPIDDK